MFNSLSKDTVTIIKSDGNNIENIKANVQRDCIFIHDKSLILEDGDKIARKLPNGLIETYLVLDNGFYHGGNGLPGGYQAKVKKESAINLLTNQVSNAVYNINAHSSNVNINPNNSRITNSVEAEHVETVFTKIRMELDAKIDDLELKSKIMSQLSELEKSTKTKEFPTKYNAFVASLANHVAVITPFLPELIKMFSF